MKKVKFILALAFLVTSQLIFAADVDVEKSEIKWLGKKIGGEHYGKIKLKNGQLELKNGQISGGSFEVDMTSITNDDLTNDDYNAKLIGHLKSDDFFGVEKFPIAKFVITKASQFIDGKAKITGTITIKGKTETITFEVVKNKNIYSAQIPIDRSKFDVRYGSKTFFDNIGDKAIDDIFTLDVKLVLE